MFKCKSLKIVEIKKIILFLTKVLPKVDPPTGQPALGVCCMDQKSPDMKKDASNAASKTVVATSAIISSKQQLLVAQLWR